MKLKLIALFVLVPGVVLAQPAPQNSEPPQSTSIPADQRAASVPPVNSMSTATPNVVTQSTNSIKDEGKSNSTNCIHVANDPYMTNICN